MKKEKILTEQTALEAIKAAQQETATAEALQQFPRILAELRKEAVKSFAFDCEAMTRCPETIKRYLTPKQWQKYELAINAETLIEKAHQKALSENLKIFINKVERVNRVATVKSTTAIDITVEWRKSKIWDYNPTAKTITNNGFYNGTATGCGYDKESDAIARTLNAAPEILKILCVAEEKRLKSKHRKERQEAIGYGSGYDAFPYFERGVGASCYVEIFKTCGYDWRRIANGDLFTVYKITKTGKKQRNI